MQKERLDKVILELGLTSSRDRAINLIKWAQISVNWNVVLKPSTKVSSWDDIILIWDDIKWVSRAGLKLEKGITTFWIDVKGKVCSDIWASTWWFCDVLLDWYTSRIYAIDVGHSQLHDKIKSSDKVINLEKTNAKDLTKDHIPEDLDLIVSDVSFISLTKALPKVLSFLKSWWEVLVLIKPQFELSQKELDKKWVVRDEKDRAKAVSKIQNFFIESGFTVKWIIDSPIKWGDWNIEYLLYAIKDIEINKL